MICDPPTPNTDISGIGVRVSFYLQSVLLALLSVRSPSAEGTTGALSTLIITNLAYAVTTLSLGFKPNPGLNLYDALIVLYLLGISWLAVFFALPQYNRFKHASPVLKILAIGQSYFLIAFGFVILASAPSFGSASSCNDAIVVAIFAPFKLLNKARIAALVLLSLVSLGYTLLLLNDYREGRPATCGGHNNESTSGSGDAEAGRPDGIPPSDPQPSLYHESTLSDPTRLLVKFDGRIVVTIGLILMFSIVSIVNTELLRIHNHIRTQDSAWGFGQILPMFLTFLPLTSTIQVFREQGLSPRPRWRRKKKRKVTMSTFSAAESEKCGNPSVGTAL